MYINLAQCRNPEPSIPGLGAYYWSVNLGDELKSDWDLKE